MTALATDGDATDTITYSLDDDAGGRFAINATSGVVTVANNTLLDYETTTSHNITVRATSSDTSTNTAGFTINLTDDNTEFAISAVSDSDAAANSCRRKCSQRLGCGRDRSGHRRRCHRYDHLLAGR